MSALIAVAALVLALWSLYRALVWRKNRLLLALLNDAVDALERAGVEYWLNWGTLLGAWREGRVLRNDTDVDIAVPASHSVPAQKVLAKLAAERGYTLRTTRSGPFLRLPSTGSWHGLRDETGLQVEWYAELGGDYVYRVYSDYVILAKTLRPLSRIELNGRTYLAPGDPAAYLERLYEYIGKYCVYEGFNTYRPCRGWREYAVFAWNQAVFYPAYFMWKGISMPRRWKEAGERAMARLTPWYERYFPPPKT